MHLTLTLFDGEMAPRSVLIELVSAQAEAVLAPRLMRALQLAIGANKVTVDTLSGLTYPPVPSQDAEKFASAYLALYLNPEAFREVMRDPATFQQVLKRFLPKEPKK